MGRSSRGLLVAMGYLVLDMAGLQQNLTAAQFHRRRRGRGGASAVRIPQTGWGLR
jgi:hypothetical protein